MLRMFPPLMGANELPRHWHPLLSLRSRVPFAEAKGTEVVARRFGDVWAV